MGRMRKTFVALVSLYIGLASGFIVPSGSPELLHENSTHLYDYKVKFNYTKLKENITNTDIGKNLLKNENLGINHQNQMYEFVTEKENNVNERSLIVLNQKFRTPLLSKLYNPQLMAYFTPLHNEDKSPLSHYGFIQVLQKPFKFEKSYFQPNLNRELPKLRNPEGYFVPHKHACSEDAKINRFYNPEQQKAISRSANRGPEVKKDFVQLLKPPIARPVDDHQPSGYLNNNKDFKKLVIENRNNNTRMQTPADIKTNVRSRYNFLEPLSKAFLDEYGQRIYANNIVTGENIESKEDVERLIEQNSEEDKIDTLIKDVLEEKSLQRNSHLYSKNCDHRECFRSTGKQYLDNNSEGYLKSTCQCLIKNNVIQRERKDLTPFPTEGAKIEDTSMDEFIKLLRT
ncbi:hypothetical protein K1T71_010842 [Dendrolimus kikuchii]|uniref:Uncharacterized protein n=1 Tax=Dendrolimus kikuchii TaxID=765133 RepID=A0ACC1CQ32_9NEOP|nr:hypothetical protein K1T71_010842 [Dendrolimus kikuchii]